MCLGLADIPRTLLFILFWHSFVKTDESCLTLKAHLIGKDPVLCVVSTTHRNLFCILQIRHACFYISIDCSALLAVKILILLMFAANIFTPFIACLSCICWNRPQILILHQ